MCQKVGITKRFLYATRLVVAFIIKHFFYMNSLWKAMNLKYFSCLCKLVHCLNVARTKFLQQMKTHEMNEGSILKRKLNYELPSSVAHFMLPLPRSIKNIHTGEASTASTKRVKPVKVCLHDYEVW